MSRTLNLADGVLALGRNLQELGRDEDALRILGRLAGWQTVPSEVAEQTHARLAELHLRHYQYAQARRHLAAALIHRPDNARYHYRLAAAFDDAEKGQSQAAYEHYCQSLELDAEQVDCLGDFGLLALKLGKDQEGLRALRRAVELAPDDPAAVGKLVEGLRRCEQLEAARTALRTALFRNPRNQAFQKLWSDFRFQQAAEAQQAARQRDYEYLEMDEPVLLPFLRLASAGKPKTGRAGQDAPVPLVSRPCPGQISERKPA
jgi:Flp pilus assembly protein TadD